MTTATTTSYFLWTVEGDLYGGTLADYARNVESGYYSGIDVGEAHVTFVDADGSPAVKRAEITTEASEPWTTSARSSCGTAMRPPPTASI